jgi:hypothetical protein
LPKFTMILQTSPTNEPGEVVNSLPPIKNPTTPLASGDTVSEPWFIEVASVGEVNALIQKQVEALTARVAELEAKVNEIAPRRRARKSEPPKSEKHEGEKAEKPAKAEETAAEKKEGADQQSAHKKEGANAGDGQEAPESHQGEPKATR